MTSACFHCRVNGAALQADGYEMHAVYGPAQASDCVLRGIQDLSKAAVNSTSCFQLSILGAERTDRRFDGLEDVTAFLSGKHLHTQTSCTSAYNAHVPLGNCAKAAVAS